MEKNFLDKLWSYTYYNLRKDEWKDKANKKLIEFVQLRTVYKASLQNDSGKSWSFPNAVAYFVTVITTIGKKILEKEIGKKAGNKNNFPEEQSFVNMT